MKAVISICALALLAIGSVDAPGPQTGGILMCDQNLDRVCDAVDNGILRRSMGASIGDKRYEFSLDLDDDGWILENDLGALFPDLDLDDDGVPNGTDNCLGVANPGQADRDDDEHGDACDCAPRDWTAFASPLEIMDLQLTDGGLSWESDERHSGSSAEYDVLSGMLSELATGSGADERCVEDASPITIAIDMADPEPGTGFYYLIRARNPCGVGTYGHASGGTTRTSSRCPGN